MTVKKLKFETWPIDRFVEYARNPRKNDHAVDKVAAVIREFGFRVPVIAKKDGTVVDGHLRLKAAKKLGLKEIPVVLADDLSEAQIKAFRLSVNKVAEFAEWDADLLKLELFELQEMDFSLDLTGFDAMELDDIMADGKIGGVPGTGSLAERFLIPPFSVLNAREGWWQDRKRGWLALGIQSELGRGETLALRGAISDNDVAGKAMQERGGGTSIFDPVLTELAYTWFSPVGGIILDPFAGGSVRGIVAAELGREYTGVELRDEQVMANRDQADEICENAKPVWVTGDSTKIEDLCKGVKADMIFSCPPYANLEVYSDDPADLSNMPYEKFIELYRDIISKSCGLLKDNSFACFVVGEIRDKKGNYRNFVGDTVDAFRAVGLNFYNEAILVTAVGSLPIRATKQFKAARKLGKTHQNILVFVKGDGAKAAKRCGTVEVYVPEDFINGEDGGFDTK